MYNSKQYYGTKAPALSKHFFCSENKQVFNHNRPNLGKRLFTFVYVLLKSRILMFFILLFFLIFEKFDVLFMLSVQVTVYHGFLWYKNLSQCIAFIQKMMLNSSVSDPNKSRIRFIFRILIRPRLIFFEKVTVYIYACIA